MLIALLVGCLVGVRAQDELKRQQQVDESPSVIYDAQWTSDGQYSLINTRNYESGVTRPDNQDFGGTYSNFWRPYSTSSLSVNGESVRGREEGVEGFDYGPVSSPTLQASTGDPNDTRPYIYPLQSTDEKPEVFRTAQGSTSNSPIPEFPQDQSGYPQVYPVFYSPGLSMNVRRRYTNGVVDDLESPKPASNASEQATSSYEETFTRVIPPVPIPSVPMSPDRLLPYGGFGYPVPYYPYPGFAPPSPPSPRETDQSDGEGSRNEAARYFSEISGAENAQASDGQPISPRVQDAPGLYGGPPNVPNPFMFPFFQPGIRPPVFPRYMGPAPMVDRYPYRRPVPTVRGPPVPPAEAANEVVPPNFLPPTFQRFPFAWQPPMAQGAIPNFVPRFIPPLVPDVRDLPDGALPVDRPPAPTVPIADDRLPLDVNVEAVPLPPAGPLPVPGPLPPAIAEEADANKLDGPVRTPYEFGFDMNDGKGTDQHRMEVSNGAGEVRGSYGYRDLFGVYRLVNYFADKNGFRAFVKSNEPGVASAGSADVIVQAEVPPPHAVEESLRASEPEAVVVPGGNAELIGEPV